MMTFQVTQEIMLDTAGQEVMMYGLSTHCGMQFSAISPHRQQVCQMAQLLNSPQVEAVHQLDLLEDMVQQLYMED
ncbi:hypothetical protein [uncultured Allofournierella sp.]|uniref:hypothetical protein n=1 Tax=uncultured Allofournierella sp. TaxID=1940258 RepID=UPI003750E71E